MAAPQEPNTGRRAAAGRGASSSARAEAPPPTAPLSVEPGEGLYIVVNDPVSEVVDTPTMALFLDCSADQSLFVVPEDALDSRHEPAIVWDSTGGDVLSGVYVDVLPSLVARAQPSLFEDIIATEVFCFAEDLGSLEVWPDPAAVLMAVPSEFAAGAALEAMVTVEGSDVEQEEAAEAGPHRGGRRGQKARGGEAPGPPPRPLRARRLRVWQRRWSS